MPGIMPTEVNEARGLDFARAARHLLRQDPQALVIGEIRDEETANIAVRAALTGHLVAAPAKYASWEMSGRLALTAPRRSPTEEAVRIIPFFGLIEVKAGQPSFLRFSGFDRGAESLQNRR